MGLIDHLEAHLGEMEGGAQFTSEHAPATQRFSIARFGGRPREGATTFVSLGLSHHCLDAEDDVRQELVFACEDSWREDAPLIVWQAVEEALRRHERLLDGGTVRWSEPLVRDGTVTGLIAADLPWFPTDFPVHHVSPDRHVVLAGLIPLTEDEIVFARDGGRERLSALIREHEPDLLDLRRASMPLPPSG